MGNRVIVIVGRCLKLLRCFQGFVTSVGCWIPLSASSANLSRVHGTLHRFETCIITCLIPITVLRKWLWDWGGIVTSTVARA